MAPKPVVGYWDFRGLAQPIRLLLAHAGVDFEDKRYSKGADGKGTEWFNVKHTLGFDFPNIPYYVEGSVKLTQSLAILRYLGRKHSLEGTTEVEKNRIAVLEQQVADWNGAFFQTIFNPNYATVKADYLASLPDALNALSKFLGNHPYVAGAQVSYADFWLYEYLVHVKVFAPQVWSQYPTLQQFVQRVEQLPRVAAYIKQHGVQPFVVGAQWNGSY